MALYQACPTLIHLPRVLLLIVLLSFFPSSTSSSFSLLLHFIFWLFFFHDGSRGQNTKEAKMWLHGLAAVSALEQTINCIWFHTSHWKFQGKLRLLMVCANKKWRKKKVQVCIRFKKLSISVAYSWGAGLLLQSLKSVVWRLYRSFIHLIFAHLYRSVNQGSGSFYQRCAVGLWYEHWCRGQHILPEAW